MPEDLSRVSHADLNMIALTDAGAREDWFSLGKKSPN
jgi:hypothetical protein